MSAQTDQSRTNWGGNYQYQAETITYPETVAQVQHIVRDNARIKGLGSRHSFNGVADTTGVLVSFAKFNQLIDLDEDNQTVTVTAGVTYGQLCPYLNERGFALPNLASLPHITVVGSCMTGTHGSGVNNGNLATAVVAIEFVAADGSLHTVTHTDDDFAGLVIGLGAYGLVTRMTLNIIPKFEMWQQVFLRLPHTTLLNNYDDIVRRAYSVSLFTTWQHDFIDQIWLKEKAEQSPFNTFFDAEVATQPTHPIATGDANACTEQSGKVGDWYERLPHFRMGFQPSSGREIQSEYFVAIEDAVEAIKALNAVKAKIAPLLFISELRTIASDDLWLSPNYQRTSAAFHFTWKPDIDAVKAITPIIEEQLMPFAVRPHWGKVYTLDNHDVFGQYERFTDFTKLVRKYDPNKKFDNAFLNALSSYASHG